MLTEEERKQAELRRQIRADFLTYVNMTSSEMTAHFATEESDFASLPPKLSKRSGKRMGKKALPLVRKVEEGKDWDDADYSFAVRHVNDLRWQVSRKVRYESAEGKLTPFAIALRNRGHDPLKDVISEGIELSMQRKEDVIRQAVRDFFRIVFPPETDEHGHRIEDGPWPWPRTVYDETQRVIVEYDGDEYEVYYRWEERDVVILPETLQLIEMVPVPVSEAFDVPIGHVFEITEATETEGPKWKAIMIRAGKAKNHASNGKPREYRADMLKAAVAEGHFNGIPGYQRTDEEHTEEENWTECGRWGTADWDEALQAVVNIFTWKKEAYPAAFDRKIRVALAEGKADDLPGCSITATVRVMEATPHLPLRFVQIRSCDWISYASAGGTLIEITESHHNQTEKSMKKKLLELLAEKGLTVPEKLQESWKGEELEVREGALAEWAVAKMKKLQPSMFKDKPELEKKLADPKNEDLLASMLDAFMAGQAAVAPNDPVEDPSAIESEDGKKKPATPAVNVGEAQTAYMNKIMLTAAITAAQLGPAEQTFVRKALEGKPFTEDAFNATVREAKDMVEQIMTEAKKKSSTVSLTKDGVDKRLQQIGDVFYFGTTDTTAREAVNTAAGKEVISKQAPRRISFKEAYIALTGDVNISGTLDASISEGISPSLALAFISDVLSKRAAAEYNTEDMATWWKPLVPNPVPLSNMRSQKVTRGGFYGLIQTVNKTTPYTELAQGTELNNSYTPGTKGGLISIHRIDIINDDIKEIAALPQRAGFSAKLALSIDLAGKFVTANPTLGDSIALFHASHANLNAGNAATYGLGTAGNMHKTVQLLRAQTLPGLSSAKMQMAAKYLIIAEDVTARTNAYSAIRPAAGQYNDVPTAEQALNLTLVVCPHATDTDDYFVTADPTRFEFLELGFLNGRDEPEIFVADTMTSGQMFTNDTMQFKVRFDYGIGVSDYRPIAKAAIT